MESLKEQLIEEMMPEVVSAVTWYQDSEVSVAYVTLRGENHPVINKVSDMTYKVIDGYGVMKLLGTECVVDLVPGSEVTIPAWTPYQDIGELSMLVTSTPPF